jgi:hypothetical protein
LLGGKQGKVKDETGHTEAGRGTEECLSTVTVTRNTKSESLSQHMTTFSTGINVHEGDRGGCDIPFV